MNRKRILISILCIAAVIAATAAVYVFTVVPIPPDSASKIALYTRNKPDAELTVAVISPEGTTVSAYGHDGVSIPVPDRSYEIGGITRTLTGALAAKAAEEGHLSFEDSVSSVLPLNTGNYSPSVFDLLTHTSAFSDYAPGVSSVSLNGSNPYSGIDSYDILVGINNFHLKYEAPYLYSCSDFGTAVLGMMISKVYDVDYYSILTIFTQQELGLENTFINTGSAPGWIWQTDDAYIAALGLSSTISDMIAYAKLYLSSEYSFLSDAASPLQEINADFSSGCMWNISDRGRIIGQSGETASGAAQIYICIPDGTAVIVLSNYRNDRYGDLSDIAMALLSEAD